MSDTERKRRREVGLPPGTPVHVGPERTAPVRITVICYDPERVEEAEAADAAACAALTDRPGVRWVNVDGIHDVELIQRLGTHFKLHPLVVEDIANTTQRPKTEEYDETLFVVAKMLTWDERRSRIRSEQVSFILGERFLLTFQEQQGDVFDLIRERLRSGRGQVRSMGAGYLLYALLDGIADYYFVVLERLGERIAALEERQITDPSPETLKAIHHLKRQMVELRRAAWPLREVASGLERGRSERIASDTALYLRDLYDHTVQIIETAETYRDMLSGLLDIYLSSVSNRMNEVMKVLTIIATIFIPLTFIAGIYGMNFRSESSPWNMPELQWYFGYPAALAAMAVVAGLMILYFRRKRWL